MKKFGIALGAAAALPFGLAAGNADAAFINGSLSFSDGFLTVGAVPPGTSIISQLTTVTQGSTPIPTMCSGNFTTAAPACNIPGASTASTFTIPPMAGTVYTYDGFTFSLTGISNVVRTPLSFTGVLGTDFEKTMIAETPLGRIGQPDDIAQVAVFLASDQSAWLTGQRIAASGGLR